MMRNPGMREFHVDDLFLHWTLMSLSGSADAPVVVLAAKRATREDDGYETLLWSVDPASDDAPRRLTCRGFSASSPVLGPRGESLAFLSQRGDDGSQVHVLRMDGGEAAKLTHSRDPALSSIEAWSGDGKRLLVRAQVQCEEDGEDRNEPERKARPPQVATFLPYRQDGAGITVGQRTHLYCVATDDGAMTALTEGDCDVAAGSWSPDGERLAFIRKRNERQRHRTDLWMGAGDGTDARVLVDSLASIQKHAWSPDGRWLALAAGEVEGDSAIGLWLVDVASGELSRIGGEDLELSTSSPLVWHRDATRLAVIADIRGLHRLALMDVGRGQVTTPLDGLRCLQGLAPCGDRLAFIDTSMRSLDELHSVDWYGGDERRHTAFNRDWFRDRPRPRVDKRAFSVPDGNGRIEDIEAWILLPAEGDGPFPTLVDMHGGPHSIVLTDFAAHTYWYLLLGRGWAIVAPNPVGSGSYGREFADRLRGRWGELDLPQVEAVVDALQEEGIADDRLACAGKSYGGFLSAWAIGNCDLFKAAAVAAPVANINSHMGTSDTGYYVTPFAMRCAPEDDGARELYQRLSPITHCRNVRAATLILQGENDSRCPRGQSEELFAHLVRCTDIPLELVMYPQSSHAEAESGRPRNRVDYHARVAEWLDTHANAANGR